MSLATRSVFALVAGLGVLSTRLKDPRDSVRVNELIQRSEADAFRERLRKGDEDIFAWPGLAAAQVSWIWLEMLNGLHNPESYKGDFSWLFSKLSTVVRVSRPEEMDFVASLAPYYFVIGHDYAGATYLMNEMIKRSREGNWHVWFWSAYHALDNLGNRRLAGDLFMHAASSSKAPPFLGALAIRLSRGEDFLTRSDKRAILEKELPPELLRNVKASRPEWFE